ncbi:sigma-70 family RNA polymerase sigma factor [Corynebacterium sp. sy039]|uniref:sigma-70 family RNA polymerase sigma factor n=1 Tax=Corynebacterium sp. sy039 TaxID=2599641 RepID=UPI0011B7F5C3|nr:sigma-70 family RNA polymerase sigma factor [Corynebacterium sp. sy039]QDZ42075.1 sigma-70 family RNA polymerase sigma factor [Corynebacterium sp. sy039]
MNSHEEELAKVVPLAVAGDLQALEKVIRIIHPLVVRYARARINGDQHPTADDVAQEICFAVATSMRSYTDRGRPFMAFVYAIASHKIADAHRSYFKDLSSPTAELPEVEDRHSPEEYVLVSDGSNKVRQLLDSLSEKAREVLILRVFVGLSAEETAEIVGSTPGAVRVAQHRALTALRKIIESGENNG